MPYILIALGALGTFLSRVFAFGLALALAKVLGWLGVGYLTYSGIQYGVDYYVDIIQTSLNSITPQFYPLISAVATDIRLNEAFSLILSAYAIKLGILSSKTILTFNSQGS